MSLDKNDLKQITAIVAASEARVVAAVKLGKDGSGGLTPDFTVTSGPDADGAVTLVAFGDTKLIYPSQLVDPQFNLDAKQIATIRSNCGCNEKGFLQASYNPGQVFGPVAEPASNGQTQGYLGKCIPLIWDDELGDYQFDKNGYMPGVIGMRFETLLGAWNARDTLAG